MNSGNWNSKQKRACLLAKRCQSNPTEAKLFDVKLDTVQNAARQMDLNTVINSSFLRSWQNETVPVCLASF